MPIESEVGHEIRGEHRTRSHDRAIGALAGHQHGVVSREQLARLGLGHGAIDHRLTRGLLHPIHRGVYAVGHATVSREGVWLAAVLAAGHGAVLSHRSAAALWGITSGGGAQPDVIVGRERRRPGIRTHRIVLVADEITTEHGIPVTTPARTLLDLAEVLAPHRLERAIHEAEYRRLASPLSLEALLARHPGRRGAKALRTIVATQRLGDTVTRSELEAAFLAFLDSHGLPRPLTNQPLGPYEVDALWPAQRLVVELDGRRAHATAEAFETDRARDRDLQAQGYRVVRLTWRQLHDDGPAIAGQVRAMLA